MTRTSLLFAVLLGACSGASAEPVPEPPPTPTAPQQPSAGIARIVVQPPSAVVPITGTVPFRAEVYDSNNVMIPAPQGLTWSMANAVVGTIDPLGPGAMFRGGPTCTADVRARIGNITGSAAVTVTP